MIHNKILIIKNKEISSNHHGLIRINIVTRSIELHLRRLLLAYFSVRFFNWRIVDTEVADLVEALLLRASPVERLLFYFLTQAELAVQVTFAFTTLFLY